MINRFDFFFIPKIDNYIIDTLKIYGIRKKQLINSQKYKHIEADTVSVLENIYLKSGGFHKQFKNIQKQRFFKRYQEKIQPRQPE